MSSKGARGFTLLELVLALAIVGALLVIMFGGLRVALAAAGATPQDVVRLNTYVVGYKPPDLAILREVRSRAFGDTALAASTLVGVQALAREGLLVEVEAIAVAP